MRHDEPRWLGEVQEKILDTCESSLLSEDSLFSMYLRSRSSSSSPKEGMDENDSDVNKHSQTVTPSDLDLLPEEDAYLAAVIDNNTTKSNHKSRKARKPRIKLRVSQPEVNSKPRFMPQLSKPKQVRRSWISVRRG